MTRPKYKDLPPDELKKMRARAYAKTYQRRGKLVPKPCERCGSDGKVEMHHTDYDKPLQVVWLCPPCHRREHDEQRNPAYYRWLDRQEAAGVALPIQPLSKTSRR